MNQGAEVREFNNVQRISELIPAWEDLLSSCPEATIFSTWEWLSSWWNAYGANRKLMLLVIPDSEGKLLALAPLIYGMTSVAPGLTLKEIRLLGDGSDDSDNLALIMRPGFEEKALRALLKYLKIHANRWDICRFNTMDSESSGVKHLLQALRHHQWPILTSYVPWSVISMPITWDLYLKSLSSKERGKIGIRTRRLEKKYSVNYFKCSRMEELPRCLDALFEIHAKRWSLQGEEGSFASPERRMFYQEIAAKFLQRGWLEFWVLEIEGKIVACLFGFRYGQTVYSLQEGFDPEYYSDSVGYVLRGYVLKRTIEEGVRRYDFLAGKDPSKERWGADVGNYINVDFARSTSFGGLYLNSKKRSLDTKEWLRQVMPNKAWSYMRSINLKLHGKAAPKCAIGNGDKGKNTSAEEH
jgi:CelD/BcsL family acetyltransferase involved in cellulose biosynthesis